MLRFLAITFCTLVVGAVSMQAAEEVDKITQYGITWHFDKKYKAGQFITGDWWVIGPVTIKSVDPIAGPTDNNKKVKFKKDQFGVTGMKHDMRMRNGSMIIEKFSRSTAYDSRAANYDHEQRQEFPLTLNANQSIVSTMSHDVPGGMNIAAPIMWSKEKKANSVLKAAAVLTCLKEEPPADAFRPAYASTNKVIYQEKDIQWDLLPNLEAAGTRPAWSQLERYMERPWIDHYSSWVLQRTGPSENNPFYGREHARVTSIVGLALLTKATKEEKRKALIGLIQYGIDLKGGIDCGQNWTADGGHYSGRKFALIFAGILLNKEELLNLPEHVNFQEDQDTYYGEGWAGQKVLWQMTTHTGCRAPYEEIHPSKWDKFDKKSEGYRTCCNGKAWIGQALCIRLLKGIKYWNHNAYFDYCDRWMGDDKTYAPNRGDKKRPKGEGTAYDAFVTDMWKKYRATAPEQELGKNDKKWVWTMNGRKASRPGKWVDNPRPADFP